MANVVTTAETNLITAADLKRAREIEFVYNFNHNSLQKFLEALNVTRRVPLQEGTTLFVYTMSGTLENGEVPEGEIIPLSKYEQQKTPVGEITLKKWRKASSAEAILKSGYDTAVRQTDTALVKDVEKGIRADFFDFINGTISGAATASGTGLQEALADAWGQLTVAFEDDTAEAVYFVNPLDIAEYLKTASITLQTAFGMNYVENFLGLGTVVITNRVAQGTFAATAKENLILFYIAMNGDLAASFDLTADELGFVGIKSGYQNEERAQIESLVMSGISLMVEYAAGVVQGTIE